MTVPVDWTAVEAIIRAAYEADPDRVRALVDPRPSLEQRHSETIEIVVAAALANPNASARDLRRLARELAHRQLGRGIAGTERSRAEGSAPTA